VLARTKPRRLKEDPSQALSNTDALEPVWPLIPLTLRLLPKEPHPRMDKVVPATVRSFKIDKEDPMRTKDLKEIELPKVVNPQIDMLELNLDVLLTDTDEAVSMKSITLQLLDNLNIVLIE
jgi:hypothetical protein